jgi:guanine deaminase
MMSGVGGPFGATIVDASGNIVAVASNSVLEDRDPTAHAEVNAIRQAAQALGTHDLSGCTLYATGYPCPMCLAAIIWAGIGKVYYANPLGGADGIGFLDGDIYSFIRSGNTGSLLEVEELPGTSAESLYDEYASMNGQLY